MLFLLHVYVGDVWAGGGLMVMYSAGQTGISRKKSLFQCTLLRYESTTIQLPRFIQCLSVHSFTKVDQDGGVREMACTCTRSYVASLSMSVVMSKLIRWWGCLHNGLCVFWQTW